MKKEMFEKFAKVAAVAVIIALVLMLMPSSNREEAGHVTAVLGDKVYVETYSDENVWWFETDDEYHVNDEVILTLFDNDSADKSDDIIMDVEHC